MAGFASPPEPSEPVMQPSGSGHVVYSERLFGALQSSVGFF